MKSAVKIAAVAAGALALWASPATAEGEVESPPNPWVHAATGTPFPAQVGPAQRTSVYEFTDDGLDASVGYMIDKGEYRATVTLYVYPTIAGYSCEEVFLDARSHIDAYEGARVVSEGSTQAPSGNGGPAALHARYFVPAGSMRDGFPAVRSEVYLYCPPGDQWLVKYRATWADGSDFSAEVETLLHAIDWPAGLGG